jgi:hypothetical protein
MFDDVNLCVILNVYRAYKIDLKVYPVVIYSQILYEINFTFFCFACI